MSLRSAPLVSRCHQSLKSERAQGGNLQRNLRAMLPSVLLPSSPYVRGVRQLADADAVEHDDDDAGENQRTGNQ